MKCRWAAGIKPGPHRFGMVSRMEGKEFYCGRCGVNKTAIRGASCHDCKARYAAEEEAWKQRTCSACGKPAVGFNIFGAFCSDEHYPRKPIDCRVKQGV